MNAIKQSGKMVLLLSIIMAMFSLRSSSQEQFRLSDYKNPDYRWQKLDLGFDLGGISMFSRKENEAGMNDRYISNSFDGSLNANYYATKNSVFYQGYQDFLFNGDFSSSSDNNKDLTNSQRNKEKYNKQHIILDARTGNRFYNSKKQFAEINFYFTGSLNNSLLKKSDDLEDLPYNHKTSNISYNLRASLPLYIGIGRIEEVQDARLAVYILDDLVKSGDLKRAPSSAETLALAQFITQTKNKRHFDTRIRKIAEITAIDSFLTVLDLKARSGASYYTLLNDNWDNANGPVRSSGGRFSIGLDPEIYLSFNESKFFYYDTLNGSDVVEDYSSKNTSHTNSWGMDFITGYTWEKPVNLYWQHTINARLAYLLYHRKINQKYYAMDSLINDVESEFNNPNLRLNLGYSIGYYPNSRTHFRLDLNSGYYMYWNEYIIDDQPITEEDRSVISNAINLSCYYYISPQLRFSLFISSNYSFTMQKQELPDDINGEETRHNLQNNIGASLTYSIF